MDGASALARGTMPTPNALRLVELIDPHNLAAHRTVAAAATGHDFRRVLFVAHNGNLLSDAKAIEKVALTQGPGVKRGSWKMLSAAYGPLSGANLTYCA